MKNATIAALTVLAIYGVEPYAVLLYAVVVLCLYVVEDWIKEHKKAPGAGKQSGTKENITKAHYRAD